MAVSKAHASKGGPVAVIAVHGVADQGKNETASTAANLLLHLDEVPLREGETERKQGYSGFNERIIRVGVDPLKVKSLQDEDAWTYQLREHLEEFDGEGTKGAYETIRLEGQRHIREPEGGALKIDRAVHIYEMHWADVSRLQLGALNIFQAIYRLLFETSWLGRQTIGKWATFGADVGKSSSFASLRGLMVVFHAIASTILTRVMPLLYVLLIAMLSLTAIPIVETDWAQAMLSGLGGYRGLFATGVVFAVVGILVGLSAKFWRILPWPPLFLVVALVSFCAWNFAYAAMPQGGGWWAEAGVALMAWGAMCLCIGFVFLPVMERLFPGTAILGVILMVIFTAGLVMGISQQSEWPLLFTGPIMAIRTALGMLPFIWMVLATSANIFLVLALIEGITLPFRRWLKPEVIRLKRARLRTAIMSIVMPVLLISFLNSTFFQLALIPAKAGGVDGAVPVVGRTANAPQWVKAIEVVVDQKVDPFLDQFASMPCFEEWVEGTKGQDVRFSDFATFASAQMVIPFLEATFLLVILVLGYSLWTVAPAALAERTRNVHGSDPKRMERLSKGLGRNLSQGYSWLWVGQLLLAFCLLLNQALFTMRAVRAREVREKGIAVAESDPMMVLADRFLGVREIKYVTPVLVAAADPATEGAVDPGVGAPVAVVPEVALPAPVAPVAVPAPVPGGAVPAPVAAPTPAPPRAAPRALPVKPTTVVRAKASGARDRFGRPLAARRVEVEVPASAPVKQAVQKQIVKEERDEIRESIQQILQTGPDISALKEIGPAPDPSGGAAAAPAVLPTPVTPSAKSLGADTPKFVIDALTEFALFFNRGPLTSALGAVILILGIGYLFFARLADPVFAGLRGGLDIALDVVNYLNPTPKEKTHRARILARYASLLRYIADWRDPADPTVGYSRIVILAHSQGSVISADILRALSTSNVAAENGLEVIGADANADGLPVRLFTMGSPLAQLYSARFPDLYCWDTEADPRVKHSRLECWWNAYRSGDYVGRMLFRTEKKHKTDCYMPRLEYFQSKDGVNLPVKESCIGPGAHTQYWNESAPDVILDLDRLIATDEPSDLAKPSRPVNPV